MAVAYYSIVQYVPDAQRDERRNVGVLFAASNESHVRLRLSHRDDLDRPDVVQRFGELLQHLLDAELAEANIGHSALRDLAHRRFSQFKISEPRAFESESESEDAIAQLLVERLVDSTSASLHSR